MALPLVKYAIKCMGGVHKNKVFGERSKKKGAHFFYWRTLSHDLLPHSEIFYKFLHATCMRIMFKMNEKQPALDIEYIIYNIGLFQVVVLWSCNSYVEKLRYTVVLIQILSFNKI